MAHGIDTIAWAGEKPWHGLGVELPAIAAARDMIDAAGLGWKVEKQPVFLANGKQIEGRFATVRQDTGAPLGVVGEQYSVLQNEDAFRFLDAITMDPNGPKYEVAGSLWGGRRVWALAKVASLSREIVPGDLLEPYLLVANSHDGSLAVRAALTSIRVVCANTLAMSERTHGAQTKLRHSGDILAKASSARDALGLITLQTENAFELFGAMAHKEPTRRDVEDVLTKLFPDTKTERAKLQRERVVTLAEEGRGNDRRGVRGTWWGLYNGLTELVDHHSNLGSKKPDAASMRLNSSWLGSGADMKLEALNLIAAKL